MQNARKMILIPSDTVDRVRGASDSVKNSLDIQMREILDHKTMSDLEKWKMYKEVLDRYLNFNNELRKPISLSVEGGEEPAAAAVNFERDSVKKELLSTVPKKYANKARLLYDKLLKSDIINWDEMGQVKMEGQLYENSNIVDLIGDALRERKHVEPNNWREFARTLSKLNVPHELIGNPRRRLVAEIDSIISGNSSINTTLSPSKLSFEDSSINWDTFKW